MMDEQASAQPASQRITEAACRLACAMHLQRADGRGRFIVQRHEALLVRLACRNPQSWRSVRIGVQAINIKSPNLISSRATPARNQECGALVGAVE